MTIFSKLEAEITAIYQEMAAAGSLPGAADLSRVVVELPREESHGDLSCNAAMVLARPLGMAPRDLASLFAEALPGRCGVDRVDIAGPGFLNLWLESGVWGAELNAIIEAGADFGRSTLGAGQTVNVEFVSANPTGPLHAAHARGAIVGDVLARLLEFAGFSVIREYYINDAGAQVDVLARSAYLRYCEALGRDIGTIPEGLYPGDYLKETGRALAERDGDKWLDGEEADWLPPVRDFAIADQLAGIKADLQAMNITMDVWSSERQLVESGQVDRAIAALQEKALAGMGVTEPPRGKADPDWEPREQLLFKSTEFGDDVDRPLQKSDGSWTYFASDVAYHMDKLTRTDGLLIDIWGADHGGYVKRMTAAAKAMSGKEEPLLVRLVQLVTLLDKGKPVKMSKRAGSFVTLADVMAAVGADAMRFIMLTRRSDQALEFDYAKVTEKSRDNPVFYVQYAHARACSVFRQKDLPDGQGDNGLLVHPAELRLIRHLASWPKLVTAAARLHEPHRIAFYLMELAALFHALWNAGRDDPALKFIQPDNAEISCARLQLVRATRQVLAIGLGLMSIKPKVKM